jgi:hypothetical protein
MFQGLNAHMVKRDLPWSGGLILKAAVCFVLVSAGGWVLNAKFNPASKTLPPEAWAGQKPAQWPALALTHDTEFRGHTPLQGATAFLVELPDKRVVAATAKHLLGPDGGVEPRLPLAEVKKALVHWSLHPRSKPQSSVAVTGIHGAPDNYPASDEWLLLDLDAKEPKYPATPLKVRQKPLARGEKVFVVGVRYDNEKNTQEIFPGKITDPGRGLIEGTLDAPANLEGFSGAPIVDADGHVVGLVTGTRSQADRQGRYATFAGHSVEEIRGSPPGAAK